MIKTMFKNSPWPKGIKLVIGHLLWTLSDLLYCDNQHYIFINDNDLPSIFLCVINFV